MERRRIGKCWIYIHTHTHTHMFFFRFGLLLFYLGFFFGLRWDCVGYWYVFVAVFFWTFVRPACSFPRAYFFFLSSFLNEHLECGGCAKKADEDGDMGETRSW